jgi:hypothetical protein
VDRRTSSAITLAVTALLVATAAIGCAKHDGTGAGASQPGITAPAALSTPAGMTGETPNPLDTAVPSPSTDPGASGAPGSTADPIDTELSDLDKLLSGLNGALSGADAGPSAGE